MASELPEDDVEAARFFEESDLPPECCAKCRFSVDFESGGEEGTCRRYPPFFIGFYEEDNSQQDAYDRAESRCYYRQTAVEWDNWCGEFQPRKKPGDEVPLDSIGLSNRAANALRRNNIYTVGSLCRFTADEFLDELDGVGCSVLNEVRKKLEKIGKALKGDPPAPTSPA